MYTVAVFIKSEKRRKSSPFYEQIKQSLGSRGRHLQHLNVDRSEDKLLLCRFAIDTTF